MTRWHPDDLAGRLLAAAENGGDKWYIIRLPALADSRDDPLGRSIGEALWPEWEDEAALARKRATIGEREFGALFQQDPQPIGSEFFHLTDLLVNDAPVETPIPVDTVFAVIDTAVKSGFGHDGTAVSYYARSQHFGTPLVALDWDIVQIDANLLIAWLPGVFARLEELAQLTHARFGALGAFIEDRNSGTVLLQQASTQGWKVFPIESKLTAMGKDERAIDVSGYISAGMVKLSRHAYDKTMSYKGSTKNHMLSQIVGFRLGSRDGAADDLTDTFTYAIAIGLGNKAGF